MSRLRRVLHAFRDETATTSVEYLVVTLFLVAAVVGASRMIVGALAGYLKRIYLVVTLPIP